MRQRYRVPLSRTEVSEDLSHYTRDPDRPLKHRRLMLVVKDKRPLIIYEMKRKTELRGTPTRRDYLVGYSLGSDARRGRGISVKQVPGLGPSTPANDPPIGTIGKVHGPVVDISCNRLPPLHQALCSAVNHETYTFEVYQHLDERHVRAITLHRTSGLRRGMPVFDTGAPVRVPVAPECLGRVLNLFGEPLDGGPAIATREFRNILGQTDAAARNETSEWNS